MIAKRVENKGQRLFLLTGKRPAEWVHIKASKGSEEAKDLMIDVVETITVPIAFHVVRHVPPKSTLSAHSKKWTAKAELELALSVSNQIYRQAGIVLTTHSYQNADINVDFGKEVLVTNDTSQDLLHLQQLSKPSCINVFVVGQLRNNQPGSNGACYDRDIIVDTRDSAIESFGRLIAHELGHAFGYKGEAMNYFRRTKAEVTANAAKIPTRYLMAFDHSDEHSFDSGITRNSAAEMRIHAKKLSPESVTPIPKNNQ